MTESILNWTSAGDYVNQGSREDYTAWWMWVDRAFERFIIHHAKL